MLIPVKHRKHFPDCGFFELLWFTFSLKLSYIANDCALNVIFVDLKALILNNNDIEVLDGLHGLTALNSLGEISCFIWNLYQSITKVF